MDAFVTRLQSTISQPRGDNVVFSGTSISERPVKRQRKDEIPDSASEDLEGFSTSHDEEPAQYRAEQSDDERQKHPAKPTDIENALPPSQSEKDAIQEYEEFKLSQEAAAEGTESGKTRKLWMKGRSSIYVDAFNLALDTVLEEEAHLFDKREKEIFSQWKALDYQSQYL
jgi:fanconi-associated nuclease 1